MTDEFKRPELTQEEIQSLEKVARQLVATGGRLRANIALVTVMAENMRLAKEVNIHRKKLGYKPLPIFEPKL